MPVVVNAVAMAVWPFSLGVTLVGHLYDKAVDPMVRGAHAALDVVNQVMEGIGAE